MDVRYIGETEKLVLTHGKTYKVVSIEKGWYRVIDDSHEDYLYPPELFEIIEGDKDISELIDAGNIHMAEVKEKYAKEKW